MLSIVLAAINGGFAYLVYQKATGRFEAEQINARITQAREFDLAMSKGFESMATFASFIPLLSTRPGFEDPEHDEQLISAVLERHGPLLDVEWGVEGVHYYSDSSGGQPVVSWPQGRAAPAVERLLASASAEETPQGRLSCGMHCVQVIALPLLRQGVTAGFLVVERSVGDSLKEFHLLSGADIVVLADPDVGIDAPMRLVPGWRRTIVGITHEATMYPLLEDFAKTVKLDAVAMQPRRFSHGNDWYEISSLSTDHGDAGVVVLLVNRVTTQVNAIREATGDSIVFGLGGLVLSELVVLLLIWGPIRRIHEVARALPLLADKSFARLRESLPSPKGEGRPLDEVDVMVEVINAVSERIESLDSAHLAAETALRESEQSLQLAQSMARVASWTGRPVDGQFFIGQGARRISRVLAHVTAWSEFLALVHPDDRREVLIAWRSGRPGTSMDVEFRLQIGETVIDIHAMADFDVVGPARVLQADGMMQDVSDVRSVQRALREHRDRLEEEVFQRTAELVEARKQAERLASSKGRFLADMSHEIRTPLNAILGHAQIGLQQSQHRRIATTFDQILDAGAHLLNVVNDVLDISKIEAGKMVIESGTFDLRKAVWQCIGMLRQRVEAKSLSMPVKIADDLPEEVVGDVFRLQQILINLLGNAVKFTDQGSIAVSVAREGGTYLFEVRDTGIGIPPDQLARLFTPFDQGNNWLGKNHEGTGLGLNISNTLATMMGGDISVQSEPGRGSRFVLRLPLRAAPEAASRHAGEERLILRTERMLSGVNVLVADDVAINRRVVTALLETQGARVTEAHDGRQAIDAVLAARAADGFDIILMDVQMPELDGREATRELRRAGIVTPVIGVTAHVSADEYRASLAAGMHDQLVKPIMQETLVSTILSYLGQAADSGPGGFSLH